MKLLISKKMKGDIGVFLRNKKVKVIYARDTNGEWYIIEYNQSTNSTNIEMLQKNNLLKLLKKSDVTFYVYN